MTDENLAHSHVIETTDEAFDRDVIERSRDVPVVVDFWSPSCGPCRMLGPILEEAAESFGGKFTLVKAQTEHCGQAAGRFNVYGIPAVFGFVDGEPIDAFEGALPQEQVERWIERLLGAARLLSAGKLEETDPAAAEAIYREALEASPNDSDMTVRLARVLLKQGRRDECREVLNRFGEDAVLGAEGAKIRAELELSEATGDIDELVQKVSAEPENLELKLDLADAHAAAGEYEPALASCLEVVQRDFSDLRERGRKTMVDIFHVLPDDSELTGDYRRKLAAALY